MPSSKVSPESAALSPDDESVVPEPVPAASKPKKSRRTRKSAKTAAAAPEATPAEEPLAAELPPPTPIQPMPQTIYSQEVIQQPDLASRAAYLHTAPPNYPAATPYQPSPAHSAAPAYVSESATQTWPAIENTLPRDESAPQISAEEAAAIAALAASASSRRFRMPNFRMPQVNMPKMRVPTMEQVKQSIPQVDTRKVGWKRIGLFSAALLALMLTIPTIYVMADRSPEAAPVEAVSIDATAVESPNTLQTLRDKMWNLATFGRGGVNSRNQADAEMAIVALSINPPVPGETEANALQAAYAQAVAALEARIAAGESIDLGIAPGTTVRNVTLKPFVAGMPVLASDQLAQQAAAQPQEVAMSAPAVTDVMAVPVQIACRVEHTVRRGEGLFTIADAYGVARRDVYRANTWVRNRPNMYLYVGDTVCIP
jgi:hypothetical protein